MTDVPQQPRVILRSTVLPAGFSDGDLRRARRSGAIVAVLPGAYLSSGDLPDLGLLDWHVATVAAAVARLAGEPVVSHLSAAVLHGLRPASSELLPVHVTRRPPAKSRRGGRVIVHRADLAADDIQTVAGLPVTAAVRTALDSAFLLPSPAAAMLITAGLDFGRLTAEALFDQLDRYRRVPGVRRVSEILHEATADYPAHSPTVIET